MSKVQKIAENVLSCMLYCSAENTFLLSMEPNTNRFWFTFGSSQTDEWRPSLQKNVKESLQIEAGDCDLLKLYKFWLPEGRVLFHAIYIVPITVDQKKRIKFNPKSKRKFKWCTASEIEQLVTQGVLRSLEVVECTSKVIGNIIPTAKNTCYEIHQLSEGPWNEVLGTNPLRTITEVLEKHVIVRTDGKNLNPYEQLVAAAGFHKAQQSSIYQYFLSLCFPCMYMSQDIFTNVCTELGWNKTESTYLFRAGNVHNTNVLSFRDFLYITAACEPNLQHGGPPAEVRCRYSFRYYDENNNKTLQFPELMHMVADIRKGWGLGEDLTALKKETESVIRNIGLELNANLHINDFLLSAGNLSLRGTSLLLRSKKSLLTVIAESGITTTVAKKDSKQTPPPPSTKAKVRATDQAVQEKPSKKRKTPEQVQFSRMLSVDSFDKKSLANEFLNLLRNWVGDCTEGGRRQIPELLRSNKTNPRDYGKNLISLCDKVREICKNEPRLVQIQSPVYILGDLHGNFLDLRHFEKTLWNLGPALTPGSFLFLGDYVDRGASSVEVVTFLFSYKLQNPQKTNLLRGNHEVRNVQRAFTFHKECVSKFGDELGNDVWEAVNKVFDCLPLAAVVDSKIFCCHGGIPPPWLCPEVSAILGIPVPLQRPEQQSPLAWDLMWNDPVRQEKLTEHANMELMSNDGFAANTYRGTAHVFSQDALQRFLMVNNFSHVIRAHEVQRTGFLVQQQGKLITVFSSSGYGGGSNEAACVLAEGKKLRVFRLDSTSS